MNSGMSMAGGVATDPVSGAEPARPARALPLARAAGALLLLAYPAAVYFGLTLFSPRLLGALLLGLMVLRHAGRIGRFARATHAFERALLALFGLYTLAIMASNSERLLLFYPAAMNLLMLLLFARSLIYPPSMIERFARLSEPDLAPAAVAYTRRVTQVWCGFFVLNGAIAAATVFATRELWALFNGVICYLLMGGLFAGEWLVRRRVRARAESGGHA